MTDLPAGAYLARAAQAAYVLLNDDAPYPESNKPLDWFGPFAEPIQMLRQFHQELIALTAKTGKVYDAYADARTAWEGMRAADDGTKQYNLLDAEIRKIAGALADTPAPPPIWEAPINGTKSRTDYVIDWRQQGTTLRQLQHRVFDPERWIVENILPEGACLIAAKYKSKKSWLALALGLPVAMGGRALGRLQVHPGRVLFLDLEGRQQRIQKRTRAILGVQQIDWPDNFHVYTKWPRADEGMRELEHWFASYPDTVLVVIDVLASFRRSMEKHELMYQYDRDTVDPLNELFERHHAAGALIHHFNKGKHDDIMDAITGSTGLPSAVNTMWALRRDVNDSNITILEMRGRDLENDDPLALRWDTYLNQHVIEGPASEVAISTERKAILKLLSDDEPRTPRDIAVDLQRPVASVQQLLRKLLNDGLIDKPIYGKYALVRKSDQSDQSDQSGNTDQNF
jgi:DNA-binding transcriptional ArsR family regulator